MFKVVYRRGAAIYHRGLPINRHGTTNYQFAPCWWRCLCGPVLTASLHCYGLYVAPPPSQKCPFEQVSSTASIDTFDEAFKAIVSKFIMEPLSLPKHLNSTRPSQNHRLYKTEFHFASSAHFPPVLHHPRTTIVKRRKRVLHPETTTVHASSSNADNVCFIVLLSILTYGQF